MRDTMKKMFKPVFILLIFLPAISSLAWGQVLNDDDQARLQNDINREETKQADEQEQRVRALLASKERQRQLSRVVDPLAIQPGGPCFEINQINIEGYQAFGRKPQGYKSLIGVCATAAQISQMLDAINSFYKDEGYITTRAYAPEQDIFDGSLDVTVIPGRIEGFVYADGRQADRRILSAFPVKRGELLNLRDLEQGLDNMNSPSSATAKFQLIPGQEPGGSFVQVGVADQKPWHVELNLDNLGFETTGIAKGKVKLGYDNLLGLNDQLNIGFGSSFTDPRAERFSDSVWADWWLSVGKWSLGIDGGYSQYYFILPGINQSYPVEGRSYYGSLLAERLLYRNQKARTYFTSGLKITRTRTFIDNFEIESQRRRLTIGSIGLRGDRIFDDAKLVWDVQMRFGLNAFDAYVLDKSIVDKNFSVFKGRFQYQKPLIANKLSYKTVFAGQYSNSILPSTEQFSIGGWGNVRGFHRDSMYGDSGFYWRNTLDWAFKEAADYKINLNVGLDAGYVEPSKLRFWSQDFLVGASVGSDVKFGEKTTLSLGLAYALSRPDKLVANSQPQFEDNRLVGYFSLNMKF